MLAKVVVHATTREAAARRLAGVLSRARIHGLVTNRDLLVAALREPDFVAGRVSTGFLAEHPDLFAGAEADPGAPVAAALALAERTRAERTVQHGAPVAWRNVVSAPQRTELEAPGADEPVVVQWWGGRDGYAAEGCSVVSASATSVTLERDGVRTTYDVTVSGPTHRAVVDVDSPRGHLRLVRVPRFTDPADAVASGSLLAPMPGSVVKVLVAQGDEVGAGDPVLVLEAMKMQHTVSAPTDGVVVTLDVRPGSQVAAGEVLAVVEEKQ